MKRVKTWMTDNRPSVLVVLLAATFLLPGLGFGLWEPWEPKYTQAVMEMGERGDYVTPFYRGEPRFSKPILPYWAIAASYSVFGVNEVATRLPFVLCALGCIGMLVHTVGRLFRPRVGVLAGIVLMSCPMFYFLARQAMPDVLFVGNLTIAFCFLLLGLNEDQARSRRMLLFYLFAGLATLSKGPLALIVIATVVGLYVFLTLDYSQGPRKTARSLGRMLFGQMKLHWGLPLVMAMTVPWYVYNLIHYETFLDRLKFDYLKRFSVPEGHHDGPISFYIEALGYGLFPWCAIVPVALLSLRLRSEKTWEMPEKRQLFFVCWLVCPFLMFSTAETKFTYYIFPVLPPLAFFVAMYLESFLSERRNVAMHFALLVVAVGFFLLPAREILKDPGHFLTTMTIKDEVQNVVKYDDAVSNPDPKYAIFVAGFILVLLGGAALAYTERQRKLAVGGLCAAAVLLAAYNAQLLFVTLSPHKTQKHQIETVLDMMGPEDRLAMFFLDRDNYQYKEWSAIEASSIFYTNNEIVELTELDDAERFFDEGGTFCIVRNTHMSRLRRLLKEKDLPVNVIDDSHYRFKTITVRDRLSKDAPAAKRVRATRVRDAK
jgi:4-amino-4-deoxy-L-arabinose transferase-like glycosyltransferase